jgi:ketosteroid isomerase-like protein
VERFFIDWLGTWQDLEIEYFELIDAGDSVVSVFRWRGRGKASGVETETTMFGVYDLREGRVVRYCQYETREEALEAAGLPDSECR